MKRMRYTDQIDGEIISHENRMLAVYLKKIKKYEPFFAESGCSLQVGLMWQYFPKDTVMYQRVDFRNGYQCYVYCVVQKGGNEVYVDSADGEAGYYSLSAAWMISSISRRNFRLCAELYTDTDDADADLNAFLPQVGKV